MGLIVIIPFGALAGWSIFAVVRWLRRGDFGREWWRALALAGAAGIALGICFAFVIQFHVANVHLEGFPIPAAISNRQKPTDPYIKADMPEFIRVGALGTDFLCGIALCLAPIAVAAFFKENKAKNFFILPRPGPPA
jgi:hypothetical protein